MNPALSKLVQVAGKFPMTPAEKEEQQIRFSLGSARIENDEVTEDMVRDAASEMKRESIDPHG